LPPILISTFFVLRRYYYAKPTRNIKIGKKCLPPKSLSFFLGFIFSYNEELHKLYSSPSIIGIIKSIRMRWAGHVARMGEERNAHRILVGNSEEKRPLGRPRRRWVTNIKINLREIGWDGVDWIDMAQDRDQCMALVYTVLRLCVP
jgi:hypothetical protein